MRVLFSGTGWPSLTKANRLVTWEHAMTEIPSEYRGWWRIVETSQWARDRLDILGPAVLSLTGHADRLRMYCLLAYVNCKPIKTGVYFTWKGAWEFDRMSGSGRVTLCADDRLTGVLRIRNGESSTFVGIRTAKPCGRIPPPLSYRDKWGSRR